MLKQDLLRICESTGKPLLVRIACHELEAWYFGDLHAVSAAYGRDVTGLALKSKYRIPDSIVNPKRELKKYVPELEQIDGAKRIAPHMNLQANTSHSFNALLYGIESILSH